MTVRILIGDVRDKLRELADESVHCVVTSPPYFGLRDYGVAGQIGLESTPAEFVAVMVEVFREVRRVLRKDGTLWLNLGDSYNAYNGGAGLGSKLSETQTKARPQLETGYGLRFNGLKPKDLLGMPWRVAFALQADGWYLRQDIIWAKPNPMPESVTDRCTKAHEYLFLLSKSAKYHYNAEAIKEPLSPKTLTVSTTPRKGTGVESTGEKLNKWMKENGGRYHPESANRRSVWTVATEPFREAHFATFPPALIEPCILAGCPRDCCAKCGAPVVREIERTPMVLDRSDRRHEKGRTRSSGTMLEPPHAMTTGWSPSCSCNASIGRGTVLDPFAGAGTTGLVADRLQRNAVLIELNPAYAAMAQKRIEGECPMFASVAAG